MAIHYNASFAARMGSPSGSMAPSTSPTVTTTAFSALFPDIPALSGERRRLDLASGAFVIICRLYASLVPGPISALPRTHGRGHGHDFPAALQRTGRGRDGHGVRQRGGNFPAQRTDHGISRIHRGGAPARRPTLRRRSSPS